MDDKLQLDLSALNDLSEEEKQVAIGILKQYAETGESTLFSELTDIDFDEIPVDIGTFLHDRRYLGNGLYDAEGRFTLFPYWEKCLHDIFPDNLTTKYNNVVLTGCLAYDTEIPLLNGTNIKIGDLAQQNKLDEYVYSYDIETNSYVPGHLVAAFSTGQKPVYNITLDNGTVIKATSNHKFMTRDKHWKSIDTGLAIGDSMMPFNRKLGEVTPGRAGYEIIENPNKVIKIEYAGIEEVYDLTVEKYHNFAINNGTVAHNSIGIGKTLVADVILLYMLYRLLCLKDPYTYYGMQPIDKISISFMNITLDAARGVGLDKMNQLILSSEWFMAHGEMTGTTHLIFRPEKHIELIAASSNNQIVGRAIFASFEDEANFSLFNNPEKQKAKMMKIITQVDARMKSRYMRTKKDGTSYLPTINIIASSKDTEQSFLEEYISNKQRNDSQTTLIIDEPQWVVDSRKDSPIKFWVAIGDKFKANELLPVNAPDTLVDEFRNKGYQMWQVPIGYIDTFQLNLDEAICSIIGIATASSLKYISGEKLLQTKTDSYRNPFVKDVIEVGNAIDDYTQYSNYFDLSAVSEEDKARPLFIHLDMSTGSGGKGDKTGIAGVWITGKANNTKSPPELTYGNTAAALATINNNDNHTMDMAYKLAFSVSIKAPKGASISFSKNRNFIRWLREQGFAIKGVSMDAFQSANMCQDLRIDGFKTEIISVDRVQKDANNYPVCMPYHYFKTAIYERRLMIYQKCDLLTDEIIGLERKSDGHIDHTKEGINCLTGDTKISLIDGRELTMLELLDEFNAGKVNYVYTVNENTLKIEPKPIINVFKSGMANKLIKAALDNGKTIKCTPEHKFMLRNGVYCEAKNLLVNDSLMPLYRKYPDELIHTVVKIEYINCQEDVYDLTIQDNPNFATTAGVFVHNSKDQCDAVCGATWLASKFSEEYSYNYGDNLAASLDANEYINDNYAKQQLMVNFEEELKRISLKDFQNNTDDTNSEEYIKRKEEVEYWDALQDGIIII